MGDKAYSKKIYELHAEICKTLSNPTRLEILNVLRKGEITAGKLAKKLGVRKANLSQHLAVLRQHKILASRKDGRNIYYRVSNPLIIKGCDILREVLKEQLKKNIKLAEKFE